MSSLTSLWAGSPASAGTGEPPDIPPRLQRGTSCPAKRGVRPLLALRFHPQPPVSEALHSTNELIFFSGFSTFAMVFRGA